MQREVEMNLRKIVYQLGILFRNNYINKNYNFLIKSQDWGLEKLEQHQITTLKKLLHYAYMNSKFYKDSFDKNAIDPNDINALSDLKKIPLLTKEELLENVEKIQIKNYPEKLFYSETSGSTGKPLVFYRNKDWDAWHRASVFRGYSWYDVKPWERNGYLWGYNFALKRRLKTMALDFLQNRFRLFSYKNAELDVFIEKLKNAVFLCGYSSMIYEIAKKINKNEKKNRFCLKMVLGTSEKIFDKYQDEVQLALGRKIISEYGAAETGIIAFECPQGNMHINMETAIVEEVDREIVVTNLCSMSFPIIRYKLGDYIELDNTTTCSCGMKHPIIKEVTGRVGKLIYGSKDNYPSLTLYYVFKNLAMEHNIVMNYQVIQEQKGLLSVYVEDELIGKKRNLLIKEFEKYFNNDIELTIIDNADLRSDNKKKKDFISNV